MGVITIPKVRDIGDAVRVARHHLLDSGTIPDGLVSAGIARSWRRSLASGLDPHRSRPGIPGASEPGLSKARERQGELIDAALPAMTYFHSHIRDSGSVIILADSGGLLLQLCGDADFVDQAKQAGLAPGASWHESQHGTNAIGTALAEQTPIAINGPEHFLVCNDFLTCAAAPITDPGGRLLGALNISGDYRNRHPHTLGLVRVAAQMIESRLFVSRHAANVKVRFHSLAAGMGTLAEGMLALTEDGWVSGANSMALSLLGLTASGLPVMQVSKLFAIDMEKLLDWGMRHADKPLRIHRPDGSVLVAQVDIPRAISSHQPISLPRRSVAPPSKAADALALLDTGDEQLKAVIGKARRVLPKSIPLLITGESGVGKELFAQATHQSGPNKAGPFVALNCAAFPENLIEAELFGYSGGAFTGARREGRVGRVREADGGTLFLDEIGDMPLTLQGRLLRVLQERVVQPLGGGRAVAVNFALVCATNRQLKEAVDAGRFRADLYYRINGITLNLPPLRERSDMVRLIAALLETIEPGRGVAPTPALLKVFIAHTWPGNLRQLSNALRTACALLAPGERRIDWEHLPEDLVTELRHRPAGTPRPAPLESLQALADQTIARTLEAAEGNVAEASRRLGISRNTLYRRMRQMAKR